jgi:CyaY protein
MWLAARSGGFHYRFDGQHWKDTRGGADLHDTLSQVCSDATGKPLTVVF